MNSIGDQLVSAGYVKPNPFSYSQSDEVTVMTWAHPDLGSLLVGVENFAVGKVSEADGLAWALVRTGAHMPGTLRLTFTSNFNDCVRLVLQARGSQVERSFGNLPDLKVTVAWDEDGQPKSRVKDQDNLDHFIVTEDGIVLQLQTSVVTRDDQFYVSNHDLWAMKVVEVPGPHKDYRTFEADGKHYAAMSLWEGQGYSGADWLYTNSQTGPQVIRAILEADIVPQKVDVLPMLDWNPPAFPEKEGWHGGVVKWFNPNIGAKVLLADGEDCFVPLAAIKDAKGGPIMSEGGFPVLSGKDTVLVKYRQGDRGRVAHTVKPA